MKPLISVIIPVKNEELKIEQCLKAVFNQSVPPIEVIVVDGHSTDNTVKNASQFPVRIFFEDYHTRAGANQIGIENAIGEFIAFTDADCIPRPDWLEKLVVEFQDGIVGVGGGILNIGDSIWEKSINIVSDSFLGSANSVQGRFFQNKKFVRSISGCNSMYRVSDLISVGGFKTNLQTAEDTDLNKRVQKLGKLIYTPNAIVLHNHKRGIVLFAKRMFQYGNGRAKSKIWDIQTIPPFIALFTLILLFFNPVFFLILICSYLLLLILMGFVAMIKEKSIPFFFTVIVIYLIEHIMYSIGFWMGLLTIS